jgi:hypothetical protein
MTEKTQSQTIQIIKDWVKIDNEIKMLQKEINSRKKNKTELSKELIGIMKSTDTECFELKNGVLLYTTKNVKKPITKKVLLDILGKYYEGDYMKASEVNDFILNNREEVVRESIVHKSL